MRAYTPHTASGAEVANPVLRAVDRFWFAPADPTLLGFIRIWVGCVALYTTWTWGIGLMGFVGPDAWVDKNAANYLTQEYVFYGPPLTWDDPNGQLEGKGYYYASPYYHVTTPAWVWTIHLSILAVTLLFTLGYETRITGVLSWLGALCYMQRCQPMLFGMDTMLNLLLLYLSIGPSGAALSIDRWLQVRRLRRLGFAHVDPPAPLASARVAMRLIQIHFCIIYLMSGTSKLQGSTWWTGTALWGCFANFTFAPVGSPWYVDVLRFLSRHRLLWELIMSGGVVYTFVMEIGLPFLIWFPRFRWLYIIGSLLFHTGIGLLMGLTTFSMLMMCMVLAFAPPELIRPWLESFRRGRQPALPPRSVPTPQPAKAPALAATR